MVSVVEERHVHLEIISFMGHSFMCPCAVTVNLSGNIKRKHWQMRILNDQMSYIHIYEYVSFLCCLGELSSLDTLFCSQYPIAKPVIQFPSPLHWTIDASLSLLWCSLIWIILIPSSYRGDSGTHTEIGQEWKVQIHSSITSPLGHRQMRITSTVRD